MFCTQDAIHRERKQCIGFEIHLKRYEIFRLCLGFILAAIVSHWLYLFMGTGFEVCESWYDYKEENDVMYNFISVFDSIARVMETEGMVRLSPRNCRLCDRLSNHKVPFSSSSGITLCGRRFIQQRLRSETTGQKCVKSATRVAKLGTKKCSKN